MRRTVSIGLILAALSFAGPAPAQESPPEAQAIRVGHPLPAFDRLRPGTRRYLRYVVQGDRHTAIDIWTRTISFDPDPVNGTRRLHIVQSWDGARQPTRRTLDSWFEDRTFRPLSHRTRQAAADGTATVTAALFTPERVRGDTAVADNSLASLDVATPAGTFNFETDMEMLSALPWREGYAARINFYHPGGGAPRDYVVRVTGAEPVPFGGRMIDSWVATLDYGGGSVSRFWIDKDTQAVLKVEARGPDVPGVLYKVLLPADEISGAA